MTSSHDHPPGRSNVLTFQRFRDPIARASICFGLIAITVLCYWSITTHKFICLDDRHYLFDSPHVASGLTWQGIAWAFKTGYFCNWHPLTWISFMLDSQLYGMNSAGFLFTNLLLHTANTVLLFLLLNAMTGRRWPAALVAGLFAWHPLHVESVAWASERKDVLSTFFFLLTLLAYTRYAKLSMSRQSSASSNEFCTQSHAANYPSRYRVLALLFFSFALMSKPMVVTLPFVLFLLDYWPLRRFDIFEPTSLRSSFPRLLKEKLSFFLFAFATSIVTYAVQKTGGAVSSGASFSIFRRVGNALLAYAAYLSKTLWPSHLSAAYPMPLELRAGPVIVAAAVVGILTVLFVLSARRHPFVAVGWLWFLGTLVPVIGLVQVGAQAMADRYTYIPSIGLFVLLVWGFDAFLAWIFHALERRVPSRGGPSFGRSQQSIFVGVSVAALAGCLACTRGQIRYWRDSETLFRHAIVAVPNNYLGYDNLGKALEDLGRKDEAISYWRKAVEIVPEYAEAQYNLGTVLLEQGKEEEAISHLKIAVKAAPGDVNAHQNLGNAYRKLGRLPEATIQYAEAAALEPDVAILRRVLGSALLQQSKWKEAALVLSDAIRLDSGNAEANRNMGVALVHQGRGREALNYFNEAVRLQPEDPEMRFNLGLALLDQNQPALAGEQLTESIRLKPSETKSHYRLAVALARQHKLKEAIAQYREALRLTPDFADAMSELARLLACAPEAELRDGTEAVKLAEKACAMTNYQQTDMLTTLAAAYAEAGRFQDAIAAAQKARTLAANNGQSALAAKAGELLELCESGRPLRE